MTTLVNTSLINNFYVDPLNVNPNMLLDQINEGASDACGSAILSLPILGEATNPGEQAPDSARIGVPLPDFDSLADIAAAKEEHDAHR